MQKVFQLKQSFAATLTVLLFTSASQAQEAESGLSAVKAVIQSASSVGGAGAYSTSEKSNCNFSIASTVPRCVNSIFGLLQMELSLQGLDNSRKVAIQILGEGNTNLTVDLKSEGFCISPLTDACTQDEVDRELVGLYEAMRDGTDALYTSAVANLQTQIDGRLAAFELNGYVIDKVNRKVTPPLGAPQSFSGGTTVAAVLFNRAEEKFSAALARTDRLVTEQAVLKAELLLETARIFLSAGDTTASAPSTASRLPASVPAAESSSFSSKTGPGRTKASSFLASFTDEQRQTAVVAPQGEEMFGSVSSKYQIMQKAGAFIRP